jgi:hypothetical protein
MMNTKSFLKNLATATLCASSVMLANVQAAAYTVTGVPAFVSGTADNPELGYPPDMQSWLAEPTKWAWNPVNIRAGNHPDRGDDDPATPDVVYIFENADDANDFSNGSAPYPDYIPDTAVGFIHWELDNGSGEFPGIMGITDDFSFKTNNCLMASGATIPEIQTDDKGKPVLDDDGEYILTGGEIPKTCGNYQGSGKRFKLVLLRTDAPLDLVFNTKTQDLTYGKYDSDLIVNGNGDPIDADLDDQTPDFLSEDIFRNYRYIMKWGNGTATDVVSVADGTPEERDGDRISGFGLQLGSYDTSSSTFTEFSDSDPADKNPDEGIGFELRLCIGDAYFNELSGQSQPGTSDCDPGYTELWLDNEYATFSPAMYSYTTDKRSSPVGGFWDKNPAGVYAPQTQTDTKIDAGTDPYVLPANDVWGTAGTHTGQTTTNYFDILDAQAEDALSGTLQGSYFGYMMNFGVISEGDVGTLPWGIYIDEDGDPATEGDLYAWWDGEAFRWGINPDRDGNTPDPRAWTLLTEEELADIAERPLDEDEILEPPRFEVGVMDDLGGLNSDTFIKLQAPSSAEVGGETINRVGFDTSTYQQVAIRMTADAIAGVPGSEDGPWVANPPPSSEDPTDPTDPDDGDSGSSSSSSGCSIGTGGPLDPTLPLLVLAGLAGLVLRRRMSA